MRLTILNKTVVVLIIIASVVWTFVAYSRGMIALPLAVTLIVVEAPTELVLAWLISRVLENPDELARKTAEEKQRLEEIDFRRKSIWEAIKEWVELSSTQQDTFSLAETPPKLAVEVEECLSQNYPSIWADRQEFRSKCGELKDMKEGKIPEEFWEEIDGRRTLHYDLVLAREDVTRRQLAAMQRQLIRGLNSEILGKHSTRLKC